MEFSNMVDAFSFIDDNFNQSDLVEHLLSEWVFTSDDIQGISEDQYIHKRFVFTRFIDEDYKKLVEAGIPILQTEYQTWVWITSTGIALEDHFYPKLVKVLYGVDATPNDIRQAKREL